MKALSYQKTITKSDITTITINILTPFFSQNYDFKNFFIIYFSLTKKRN